MKMHSEYGRLQRYMHPTQTNQEVGYLGLQEKIIDVGNVQHMVFQEGGYGPFWVTPQEHIATNYSHYDEPQLKDKKKDELLGNLKSSRMDVYGVKGKRLDNLHDIAYEIISM